MKSCFRVWWPFGLGLAVLALGTLPAGRLPTGDAPHLLAMAQRLANTLVGGDIGSFAALLAGQVTPHPPAGYLVPTLGYAAGLGGLVPFVTGAVGLALVWHGMVLLVRGRTGESRIPVAGGVLLLGSGLTWATLDGVALDLLAAGLVTACIGHMVASDGLAKPRHAVAIGVLAGLGCLTKYTVPVFLVVPSLVIGLGALRRRQWRGVALVLLGFAVVAGPWLLDNIGAVLAYVSSSTDPGRTISDSPAIAWADRLSWTTLGYYPTVLRDAVGWPGLALLALSLPGTWHPGCRLGLLGALGGGLALTFVGEQQARYLTPALPLLAVLVDVGWAPNLRSRRGRRALAVFAVATLPAIWGAFATSYVHTDAPSTRSLSPQPLVSWGTWPWPAEAFRPTNLQLDAYAVDRVVAELAREVGDGPATVGIALPRHPGPPPASAYMWRAEQQGHSWTWATVTASGPGGRAAIFSMPNSAAGRGKRFTVAYALRVPGGDGGPVVRMAESTVFTHRTATGEQGAIVRVPDEAWATAAGRALLRDPMGR